MKNFIIYWTYFIYYFIKLQFEVFYTENDFDFKTKKLVLKIFLQHHYARQRYDKKYPYFYHLKMVSDFVFKFKECLTQEDVYKCYIASLWHDSIEDLHNFTYSDIKKLLGKEIADIVFTCTELRGKTREQRHGEEYILDLQKNRLGTYVKLCDICANMTMGVKTGSLMLEKYQKEYTKTKAYLYREEFKKIFEYIESNLLGN